MVSRTFGNTLLELVRGDLTDQAVDAIINAANPSLLGGGGVDGAIHRAAGPALLEECRTIARARGPLPPGEAVLTRAYSLPCRFVIHTVGPIWAGGGKNEAETLAGCYRSSLNLALEHELRSVAFPSIATGAFGYPIGEAASVALQTAREVLLEERGLERVLFVLFVERDLEVYRKALEALRP